MTRTANRRVIGAVGRAVVAAAVVTGALAGCTEAATPADPDPSPSRVPTTAAPSPTGTSSDAGTPPAPDPTPSPSPMTVSGVVTAGVEPGCLVLEADGETYLLLGVPEDVEAGDRVTVQGTLPEDVMTTCQQGTALLVQTLEAG